MQIENLTKQYDGKTVVDSVSFQDPAGEGHLDDRT